MFAVLMDSGLLICSSHEPEASGFVAFDAKGNSEAAAVKGMLWARWGSLLVLNLHMAFVNHDSGPQRRYVFIDMYTHTHTHTHTHTYRHTHTHTDTHTHTHTHTHTNTITHTHTHTHTRRHQQQQLAGLVKSLFDKGCPVTGARLEKVLLAGDFNHCLPSQVHPSCLPDVCVCVCVWCLRARACIDR
jgi:hypothetical protein